MRLAHLAVFHLFGFGPRAFRYHLPRLGFRIIGIRMAMPSQGDAYPHAQRWSRLWGHLLKTIDHRLYHLFARLRLDRKAWGLSIEVMACKVCYDGFSDTFEDSARRAR